MLKWFEWLGSLAGLLGSFLLATNTSISAYGWYAFLIANIAMIFFSAKSKHYGLLTQQLGFVATSTLGIYRAGLF